MSILSFLLLPFAWLYQLITSIRNYRFDKGYKKSHRFEVPVICVGNLNVGGSGKTPMVEYLVRLLADTYPLAILSRGYGRATAGFRMAAPSDDAESLGDEPYQYFLKWQSKVKVAVGEKRAPAILSIMQQFPSTRTIILDDAFQHRHVSPAFSILLTDYAKPFYDDFLLPAGRLRESRAGAQRADVVVVTKCPDEITQEKQNQITKRIQQYAGKNKPVFFTKIAYRAPVAFCQTMPMPGKVVLVSAIANSAPLQQYVAKHFELVKHFRFADHHAYSKEETEQIQQFAAANGVAAILTTEKDMVKLIGRKNDSVLKKENWFYIPVESTFLNNGSDFDYLVKSKL